MSVIETIVDIFKKQKKLFVILFAVNLLLSLYFVAKQDKGYTCYLSFFSSDIILNNILKSTQTNESILLQYKLEGKVPSSDFKNNYIPEEDPLNIKKDPSFKVSGYNLSGSEEIALLMLQSSEYINRLKDINTLYTSKKFIIPFFNSNIIRMYIYNKYGEKLYGPSFRKTMPFTYYSMVRWPKMMEFSVDKKDLFEISVKSSNTDISYSIAKDYLQQYEDFLRLSYKQILDKWNSKLHEERNKIYKNLDEIVNSKYLNKLETGIFHARYYEMIGLHILSFLENASVWTHSGGVESKERYLAMKSKVFPFAESGGLGKPNILFYEEQIQALDSQLSQIRQVQDEISVYMSKNHPESEKLARQKKNIDVLKKKYEKSYANSLRETDTPALFMEKTGARLFENSYKKFNEAQEQQAEKLMQNKVNITREYEMERLQFLLELLYQNISVQRDIIRLKGKLEKTPLLIIDKPVVIKEPSGPNYPKIILMLSLSSFLFVAGITLMISGLYKDKSEILMEVDSRG